MDPIAKAKMVALKGIKKVLSQDPLGVPSGMNRYYFLVFDTWEDNKKTVLCI